jgi:hypothetical protein
MKITGYHDGTATIPYEHIVTNGHNILGISNRKGRKEVKLYTGIVQAYNVDITNISIKEILNYITIEGTYTRAKDLQYGLQTLALETNSANVPTGICPTICGKDDGRYIMIPMHDSGQEKQFITECLAKITGETGVGITKTPCSTQLVQDPDFNDPSKWTVTPGNTWTVSGGKATCNTIGAVYCEGYTKINKVYDIKITIDPGAVFTGVGLTLRASYDQEVHITTEGTHEMTMTAEGSNTYIILDSLDQAGTPAFVGSVSYLSVLERA